MGPMAGGPGRDEISGCRDFPPRPEEESGPGCLYHLSQRAFPVEVTRHEPAEQLLLQHRNPVRGHANVATPNTRNLARHQATSGTERHEGEAVEPGLARQMIRPIPQVGRFNSTIRRLRSMGRGETSRRSLSTPDPHQCLLGLPQPGPVCQHRRIVRHNAARQDERVDRLGSQPSFRISREPASVRPHRNLTDHVQQMLRRVAGSRSCRRHGGSHQLGDRRPMLVRQPGLVVTDLAGDL